MALQIWTNHGLDDGLFTERLHARGVDPHLVLPIVSRVERVIDSFASPGFHAAVSSIAEPLQSHPMAKRLSTVREFDFNPYMNQTLHALTHLYAANGNAVGMVDSYNYSFYKEMDTESPVNYSDANVLGRKLLEASGVPSCPAIASTADEFHRVATTLRKYYVDDDNTYIKYGLCDYARVINAPSWEKNGCKSIVSTYHDSFFKQTAPEYSSTFYKEAENMFKPYRGMKRSIVDPFVGQYSSPIFKDETSNQLKANYTRRKSGETIDVIRMFSDITDTDWESFISDTVSFIASDPSGDDDSKTSTMRNSFRCDHTGAVMCKNRAERKLIQSVELVIGTLFFVLFSVYFGMGDIGSMFAVAIAPILFLATPFVISYVHYEVGVGCLFRFIPALPVCLMDDIYYMLEHDLFPEHLEWPSVLVTDNSRTATGIADLQLLNVNNIGDCAADPLGFGNGIRHVFYVFEVLWRTIYPGDDWRETLDVMGSTDVMRDFMQDVDYYKDKDVLSTDYRSCFYLTSPTLIFYTGLSSFQMFIYGFVVQAAIRTIHNIYVMMLLLKQLARTLVVY